MTMAMDGDDYDNLDNYDDGDDDASLRGFRVNVKSKADASGGHQAMHQSTVGREVWKWEGTERFRPVHFLFFWGGARACHCVCGSMGWFSS